MKPIRPEDRNKVIVLIVLMVVVLGLLAKTLLGIVASKNSPPANNPAPPPVVVATNTPPPGPAAGTPGNPAPAPRLGLGSLNAIEIGGPTDPFRKVLPDQSKFSQSPPPITPRGSKRNSIGGSFPLPNRGGSVEPADVGKAVPVGPPIKLEGVMADRENYAMVTVAGKTDMYRAGNRIAGLYEILSIDEYGASFRGPNGTFRLEVGEEHTPMAAPAPSPMTVLGGRLPLPGG